MAYDAQEAAAAARAAQAQRTAAGESVEMWHTQQPPSAATHSEYIRRAGIIDATYEVAVEPHRQTFFDQYPGAELPRFLRPGENSLVNQLRVLDAEKEMAGPAGVAEAARQRDASRADVIAEYARLVEDLGIETRALRQHRAGALKAVDEQYEEDLEVLRVLYREDHSGQPLPPELQYRRLGGKRGGDEVQKPGPAASEKEPERQVLSPRDKRRWKSWAALSLILVVALFVTVSLVNDRRESREAGRAIAAAMATKTVLYEVEGTAKGVNLTVQAPDGTAQLNDKAVPLANKRTGVPGLKYQMPAGSFVYMSAQNTGSSGTITCRITVDGVVVAENSSSGGYSIATCEG